MENPKTAVCALCDTGLSSHPILENGHGFCCVGCHAVFNILASKKELDAYQSHPIFLQALRSGLISNQTLLESIKRNQMETSEGESERLHLEINEMWCPACAELIRYILLQKKGIRNCVVDYSTDLASIEYLPLYISKESIYQLIKSFGYHPVNLQDPSQRAVSFDLYLRFVIATFFSLNIMMFAYPLYATYFEYEDQGYGHLFAWLSFAAALPVIGYSGWPIFRRFISSLQVGLLGMETLVVIGVGTAFGLSVYELLKGATVVYFDSMTVIIVFVLLGKIIEARAKFSAKDALVRLSRGIPRRARKRFIQEGHTTHLFTLTKEIHPGDIIAVFSGEKIALDGIVVEGEGGCDESLMTGEALPVMKKVNSQVLGGAILQHGAIAFRVTSSIEESALHRILDMVQKDIGHKSSYIRAADHIVRWFVPFVLFFACAIALLCWLFGIVDGDKTPEATAMIRAVSILLISCPCAIGIAAPLAESHLMNRLASLGVIVRNRGALVALSKEAVFVFDKTGTITRGSFTVLEGLELLSESQRALLKGMAMQSNHLVANAVARSISEPPTALDRVEELIGKGLKGILEEQLFYLGSSEFLKMNGMEIAIAASDFEEKQIVSSVYFAQKEGDVVRLLLGDQIRSDAKELIAALAPSRTVLLSGDSEAAVLAVAKACGMTEWHSGCNPMEKREFIDRLRREGCVVCMVGDGINDAPALTGANVGISVISATDISIQVSDLLLTTERLGVIPQILTLAKKGQSIVKQNLFWAFFYNVIGLGLAAVGLLSPIFAAFAMVTSSLMVLFNAKRISFRL